MRTERVLLLVHEKAAAGHSKEEIAALSALLERALPGDVAVEACGARDHTEVRARARAFAAEDHGWAAIISGGGGGTLRAVVEGVIDARPGPKLRIAPLRLGSGNVLARRLGMPRDPRAAIAKIAASLSAGGGVPMRVMRCTAGDEVHHAVTLAAFGQIGRLAGDVARLRHFWPALFSAMSKAFGIERINHAQYAAAFAGRSVGAILDPDALPLVEIAAGGAVRRMKLHSAVAMKMPVPEIPFDPGVELGSDQIAVAVLPWRGPKAAVAALSSERALAESLEVHRFGANDRFELRLLDRPRSPFFLDEDPLELEGHAVIEPADGITLVAA